MIKAVLSPLELVEGQETDLTVRLTNAEQGTCTNIVFKLALPEHVLLLRGSDRVEVGRLGPGESISSVLRVRPQRAGRWTARSPNYSYRDRHGFGRRVQDFEAEFVVALPPVPASVSPPKVRVELVSDRLSYQEWDKVQGRVGNVGEVPVHDVVVQLTGQFEVDTLAGWQELGTIEPGDRQDFSVHVRADHRGSVPVHVETRYVDETGRRHVEKLKAAIKVAGDAHGQYDRPDRFTILYLAANPIDSVRVRVDEEIRSIRETLSQERFALHSRFAVRARDITESLLAVSPRVVHFSGHGTDDGRIYVENNSGRASPVPIDGLAAVFELMADVDCVIVNACHTEALAEAIARHVEYVIGMSDKIEDRSAIAFSIGFYQALAAGRGVPEAFRLGCAQIRMQPVRGEEHLIPRLITR